MEAQQDSEYTRMQFHFSKSEMKFSAKGNLLGTTATLCRRAGANNAVLFHGPNPHELNRRTMSSGYQGNCVLGLVVDGNGRPTNIRVLNALGMGLDEKAIESVKNWKFEPGKKDGHDVAVEIAVEVDFHLY
jgi:TonB family protein